MGPFFVQLTFFYLNNLEIFLLEFYIIQEVAFVISEVLQNPRLFLKYFT